MAPDKVNLCVSIFRRSMVHTLSQETVNTACNNSDNRNLSNQISEIFLFKIQWQKVILVQCSPIKGLSESIEHFLSLLLPIKTLVKLYPISLHSSCQTYINKDVALVYIFSEINMKEYSFLSKNLIGEQLVLCTAKWKNLLQMIN